MNDSQTLVDLIEQSLSKYTANPAFTCLGKTLSYGDLDSLSSAFAAYLQSHTSLAPGDRIAIQLPNLLQYPVVAYGALRAGMVVVNTNPLYTIREMQHQFSDAGARALVVLSDLGNSAREIAASSGIETLITTQPTDLHSPLPQTGNREQGNIIELREALAIGECSDFSPVAVNADDLAVLQYTGGTTGVAKGAMLLHRNLVANVRQAVTQSAAFFQEGKETYVNALPLYHIYAFTVHMLALLSRGGHNLLIPNPRDADALVEAIRPHPFTGFPGINTLFAGLCRHPGFRALDFSSLKSTSAGGMALSDQVLQQWHQLTGITIAEGYGMTEASPVISSNPPGRVRPGTVGIPVPDTEVKVIDNTGTSLPNNEAGELCVRGPQVMAGYWQRPQATREVLSEDGWLRTGDIAVIDEDGYLRIVDRLKDMIVVSGFNVYPNELEEIANSHPQVLESAAISVPDTQTGEAVKLYVVTSGDSVDEDELRDFLRTQLTAYKVPKHIEQIDALPKSNVGKILRRQLRDQVLSESRPSTAL